MNDILTSFNSEITASEQFLASLPQLTIEVEHEFADGMYRRKATAPAGSIIVSKVHKYDNFAFIVTGDVSIISETGTCRMQAPQAFVTTAGTKRMILAHTDSVWYTVHRLPGHLNEESDAEEIETYFTCDTLEEYDRILLEVKS